MKLVAVLLACVLLVSCASAARIAPCPNMVYCFVSPCAFPRCDNIPQAVCHEDYCGGCNYHFMLNGEDVTAKCNAS